ncbi:MAG: DUF4159 domain-containing protein [Bryobacteraceae bacterium]|nr:DUF4159 domain-containing protein [Bryobacteraceae bacterium]
MLRRRTAALFALLLLASVLLAQRRFRSFDDEEDNPAPMPADAAEKTEFQFGRLRYSSFRGGYRWGSWATDYPKADRQFLQGLRRLSRIHTRSVEQVVDIDNDEIYQYPWLYAVEVGRWEVSESQAARMREYFNRGGFLMVDDFHGPYEWEVFASSMRRIFPDRQIVDIENSDQVFHVLYDLVDRPQVPGIHTLWSGSTWEKGGIEPRWRGVYDDKGRLLVAICHNMDLGDAWEWADHPRYPERYASLAYRIALNYIIYSMSH